MKALDCSKTPLTMACRRGRPAESAGQPNRGAAAIRLMGHRNRRMCFPRVSFPPCL